MGKGIKCHVLQHKPIIIPVEILEKLMIEPNPQELIATYVMLLYRDGFPRLLVNKQTKTVDWPSMGESIKKLEELGLLEVVG